MGKLTKVIAAAFLALCGLFCSSTNAPTVGLDTTVVGNWMGALGAIPTFNFKGVKVFVSITQPDSSFQLITRDTTRAATPTIKDTTVVLTGAWRLNTAKDSVLLLCDSCRILDTAQNTLVARTVKGQVISADLAISKQSDGMILWEIRLSDFAPLIPLIGLDLSAVPPAQLHTLLFGTMVVLEKTASSK